MWRQKRRKQMRLKNEKERNEFLKDYRNEKNGWYLWKQDEDLQRRWWRRDFNTCFIVVEENLRTSTWPKIADTWWIVNWFIIEDPTKPFANGSSSITTVRNKLKELTTAGKEI